jgi:flagellar biogenesis protein FliO
VPIEDGSYTGLLVRMVLSLAVVSALLYVVLRWLMPRLARWRFASTGPLVLVDRLHLGGGRSVCLLRAAGRYFLLGVTDGGVRLLSELPPGDVEAAYPAGPGAAASRPAAGSVPR